LSETDKVADHIGFRSIGVRGTDILLNGKPDTGKNLTTIYATHGHGDHFFGVNTIQKQFPKARFVATREVIAVM
jgi:glyoxylase-like metal-dependent hydrolase (beta-lactamase superfamily II)